jgi:glycosyltransferase involved in cell wall biosynthesis
VVTFKTSNLKKILVKNDSERKIRLIVTGTDPNSLQGGIGAVMSGYLAAAKLAGFDVASVPTYHPTQRSGKWFLWFRSLPSIIRLIKCGRKEGEWPVVYSHAGAGISLLREALVLLVSRISGARTLIQIHAPQVDGYLKDNLKAYLLKIALLPADMVCLLTPWWRDCVKAKGICENCVVIPNPLTLELEKTAGEWTEKGIGMKRQRVVTVLTMARLVSGKGVDVAIRAISRLPEWIRLIVAGDGNERRNLEKITKQLQIDKRVQFLGWVSGNKKTSLLKNADVFCLPSTNDAFPISLVEAMAYGVPVVAVKWGGIQDMVSDARVGFLAENNDPEEVAGLILRIACDDNLRQRMGTEAKKWVLEISSAKVVGEKLKEVVMSIADR